MNDDCNDIWKPRQFYICIDILNRFHGMFDSSFFWDGDERCGCSSIYNVNAGCVPLLLFSGRYILCVPLDLRRFFLGLMSCSVFQGCWGKVAHVLLSYFICDKHLTGTWYFASVLSSVPDLREWRRLKGEVASGAVVGWDVGRFALR